MPRLIAASAIALVLAAPTFAEDASAGLDAHVHGEAQLAAALDGQTLTVEFKSPLYNLTGFEHAPKTSMERTSIDNVLRTFNHNVVVQANRRAECEKTSTDVDISGRVAEYAAAWAEGWRSDTIPTEDDGHAHEADHDDHHEHDHEQEHAHHDHDDHHDHAEHDHGEHDHSDHKSGHTDLMATYVFECAEPDQLTDLNIAGIMGLYNRLETVNAVFISDDNQLAQTLNKRRAMLDIE
ncbi:MAG: DUF2796 domain-containing protein [Pseudomonadota bacterium]